MPNYNLKFGISEVARILKVEREIIKTWAYTFADYLNPDSNPPKGIKRQFTLDDICTCGYISMYWESDPDIESIKRGLNAGEQFEYPYIELTTTCTPIFRDLTDDCEGYTHGTIIGGIIGSLDTFLLADSYKFAGDMLVDAALEKREEFELSYPVIYNYRHATELYLKAIIGREINSHDLFMLLKEFKGILKSKFSVEPPEWFEDIILVFNDFDPGGTTFRYGLNIKHDEMFVDLQHIKKLMGWLAESFQNVKKQIALI